jgi:hypothetical protein
MSLIHKIENLSTFPRRQEEDCECTSEFLEWFYYNVYRQQGFSSYPILAQISSEPEYECIHEQCRSLINFNNAKELDNETLIQKYETMKKWTLDMIQKYN